MIKLFYLCVVFTLCTFVPCVQQQRNNNDKLPVDAIAIPVKKGWGLQTHPEKRLYIKQDFIPVISGLHQFVSRKQALTTANLVLAKMKDGKTLLHHSGFIKCRNRYFKIVLITSLLEVGFYPAIAQRGFLYQTRDKR